VRSVSRVACVFYARTGTFAIAMAAGGQQSLLRPAGGASRRTTRLPSWPVAPLTAIVMAHATDALLELFPGRLRLLLQPRRRFPWTTRYPRLPPPAVWPLTVPDNAVRSLSSISHAWSIEWNAL